MFSPNIWQLALVTHLMNPLKLQEARLRDFLKWYRTDILSQAPAHFNIILLDKLKQNNCLIIKTYVYINFIYSFIKKN